VRKVMDNIAALSAHGYRIDLNYSLGPYNQHEFCDVLDFAIAHELFLKAIAFVRPNEGKDFYDGEWVDPDWNADQLCSRGAIEEETRDSFGGTTTTWSLGTNAIKVKNVAKVQTEDSYALQILRNIDAMIGNWENALYSSGAPI